MTPERELELITKVRKSPYALSHIRLQERTDTICLEAVKINGNMIQYVPNKTNQICKEAVLSNPYALRFIENPTFDIVITALSKNSKTIRFVTVLTKDIEAFCKLSNIKIPKKLIESSKIDINKDRNIILDRVISLVNECLLISIKQFKLTGGYQIRESLMDISWDIMSNKFYATINAVPDNTPKNEEADCQWLTITIDNIDFLFNKRAEFLERYEQTIVNQKIKNRIKRDNLIEEEIV